MSAALRSRMTDPRSTRKPQTWNSRYLAYCAAEGRTPEAQIAHDRERWPGGHMAGFVIFMSHRWSEWRAENGVGRDDFITDAQHAEFDAWLATWLETKAGAVRINEPAPKDIDNREE